MTRRRPTATAAPAEPGDAANPRASRRRLLAALQLAALPAAMPALNPLPAAASTTSSPPDAPNSAPPRELTLEWGGAHLHGRALRLCTLRFVVQEFQQLGQLVGLGVAARLHAGRRAA